jgi:hypothetical protein
MVERAMVGRRGLTGGGAMERGVHRVSISGLTGRGWQCGDRAMAVKMWWWRHSVWVVLGRGEKRRRAGRGAVEYDWALRLYRGRGGGRRPVIKMKKWPVINGDETA